MELPIRPLVESFHDMPEPRHPRGRRHPLVAMLAVMCVARLCGDRRDGAMTEWGRGYGQKLARALGVSREKTPCAATFSHVLRNLDCHLVEATLGAWAASVLTALPPAAGEPEARAIAGKTLRGSRQPGAPAVHRLSVLRHRLGLTWWQQAVADQMNERPVLEPIWRGLGLEGWGITVDAWLTQRAIAPRMVEGGDDGRHGDGG